MNQDKLTPGMLRDLACALVASDDRKHPLTADEKLLYRFSNVLHEEAARREAEVKPQKRCDRLIPPVCLHPDACVTECAFNKPATACATTGEREGPGSAAAPKFMPSAIGPFGFCSKDTDVTEELCIHRVRHNIVDGGPEHEYDSIGLTVADIHAKDARIEAQDRKISEMLDALWTARADIEALETAKETAEADKAELVAVLDKASVFIEEHCLGLPPTSHARRLLTAVDETLAKHGGA